jgi:hypothetical protein
MQRVIRRNGKATGLVVDNIVYPDRAVDPATKKAADRDGRYSYGALRCGFSYLKSQSALSSYSSVLCLASCRCCSSFASASLRRWPMTRICSAVGWRCSLSHAWSLTPVPGTAALPGPLLSSAITGFSHSHEGERSAGPGRCRSARAHRQGLSRPLKSLHQTNKTGARRSLADRPQVKKGIAVSRNGKPVAYIALEKGTPVTSQSGRRFGTVDQVLDDSKGNILHGIVVATRTGNRFVARDCIEEMTTTRVRCSVTDEQVSALPVATPGPRHGRKPWFARRA